MIRRPPRSTRPDPPFPYTTLFRSIVFAARKASLGPNLTVNRILPFRLRRMVGPFIFMDHAGPVDTVSPEAGDMDVLPHPHIGLSTVSYLDRKSTRLNSSH